MPLGFERINERTQRPNAHINFIRTIPGSTSTTAQQILNRTAAVCYPFMKDNYIFVQALEEFPYNTEFVGRNFNAGEVIQLVLRDRNGRWLPQRMVEMVMVHELAHCKQMNHSKAFWKVRDDYAVRLRELWARGYTGEGLWGRGRELDTGTLSISDAHVGDVPEHLCGGTYGRRARKRKRGGKDKPVLSYAERKQRRILKKFGAGGQALGADEDTKVKLEGGVPKKGKPRVAGSARGRELRAAAALARFETVKKEEVTIKTEDTSSSESEVEDGASIEDAAIDVDGKKMLDDKGRALIKICEDEDGDDHNAQREMDELRGVAPIRSPSRPDAAPESPRGASSTRATGTQKHNASSSGSKSESSSTQVIHLDELWKRNPISEDSLKKLDAVSQRTVQCDTCSLENDGAALTCVVCSNVLKPDFVLGTWRCKSNACNGSQYINSGDAGSCGVCGS